MKKVKITNKQFERISLIYRVGGFFLVLSILTIFSIIFGKLKEFYIMFICYFASKGLYSKQFHATSLKVCFLSSILLFCGLVLMSLSINITILFPCLLGLVTSFISYYASCIQFKLKDYSFIEPKYNELVLFYEEHTRFDVKNCSKDELLARCRGLGLNPEQTDFCVKAFIDKLSAEKLADYCYIEVQSAKNKKQWYKHKLNGQ